MRAATVSGHTRTNPCGEAQGTGKGCFDITGNGRRREVCRERQGNGRKQRIKI